MANTERLPWFRPAGKVYFELFLLLFTEKNGTLLVSLVPTLSMAFSLKRSAAGLKLSDESDSWGRFHQRLTEI